MATTRARSLDPAETAKLIRAKLKDTFPKVKFSVKTHKYSMGSSIYVKWTDGPTTKRVKEITGGFEGKGFDAMTDCSYYINAWVLNGEILGTMSHGAGTVEGWGKIPPHDDAELVSFGGSYITETREISPALANRAIAKVAAYYGTPADKIPTAIDGHGGFSLAKKDPATGLLFTFDAYLNGPVNGGGKPDHPSYTWYATIAKAAADATAFVRKPAPPAPAAPTLSLVK